MQADACIIRFPNAYQVDHARPMCVDEKRLFFYKARTLLTLFAGLLARVSH
jgi:hypothetical protein